MQVVGVAQPADVADLYATEGQAVSEFEILEAIGEDGFIHAVHGKEVFPVGGEIASGQALATPCNQTAQPAIVYDDAAAAFLKPATQGLPEQSQRVVVERPFAIKQLACDFPAQLDAAKTA